MKTFHLVTLFISWDAQNKQNGVLFWILAVAIYIMEASFIRTRTRKLIMKWQAGHPWLQDTEKKLWFIVNHCGYFFGKCGASFRPDGTAKKRWVWLKDILQIISVGYWHMDLRMVVPTFAIKLTGSWSHFSGRFCWW